MIKFLFTDTVSSVGLSFISKSWPQASKGIWPNIIMAAIKAVPEFTSCEIFVSTSTNIVLNYKINVSSEHFL